MPKPIAPHGIGGSEPLAQKISRIHFQVEPIYRASRPPYFVMNPKRLADFDLWFFESARGEITVDGKTSEIKVDPPGELFFFKPGEEISSRSLREKPTSIFICHFMPRESHLWDAVDFPARIRLEDRSLLDLFEWGFSREMACAKSGESPALARKGFLCRLLDLLIEKRKLALNKHQIGSHREKSLWKILDYAETHLDQKLSLEELGRIAGIDRTTVVRLFHTYVKSTPVKWILARRLEKSRELLGQGFPVHEAAHHLGFSDAFSFSKAFKAHYKIPPSEYVRGINERGLW